MEGYIKGKSRFRPLQQPGHEDQVGGTADGEYLSKSLQGAQDSGMDNVHACDSLKLNKSTVIGL
jgi:hypothetical protein